MVPGTPRTSPLAILLALLAALGACALFAGALGLSMLGSAWPIAAGGTVALIVGLGGLWWLHRRRDRTLW